jgi:hypothetical protein
MAKLLRKRRYARGRTAVFITFDEAFDGSAGNHVPTVVVAPSVPGGKRSGARLTLYSLLRTTENMFNLDKLRNAARARGMRELFHL